MNSIFNFILTTSLYASVVGIVILILKIVLKNKLNPKWHYMIWIILIIKMLMPFGPESSISIFNTVPQITQQNNFTQIYLEYHEAETLVNKEPQNLTRVSSIQDSLLFIAVRIETTLPYIWVGGASLMLGWVIYTKYSLLSKIKRSSFTVPESINDIFEECKGKMKIQKDIKIIIQNAIFTPSLFGIFKPKILISPLILQLRKKDISYVLLHELAHFKRKDIQVNQLLLLLQIIHWFNPVIWFCFKKIRQDMELSADEKVLSILESGLQSDYGRALLSVIENYSYSRLAPRLIGLFDGKKDIARRLKMINMAEFFKRKKKSIFVLSIVCILFLSVILLTSGLANNLPNSSSELTKSDTGDDKIAEEYVKSKGYKISVTKGEIEKYTLEKSEIQTMINQQVWGVQDIEPDKYFGKEITVYGFTVINHLLEKIYKQSNGVNVYIMLSQGKVIGGYSYPNNNSVGAFYSLNGKTLEEVSGLSFQKWKEKWKNKYGN